MRQREEARGSSLQGGVGVFLDAKASLCDKLMAKYGEATLLAMPHEARRGQRSGSTRDEEPSWVLLQAYLCRKMQEYAIIRYSAPASCVMVQTVRTPSSRHWP